MQKLLQGVGDSVQSRIRNHDSFPVSMGICFIGILSHFSFIFLFAHWGVTSLSYFNILSTLLWVWTTVEVVRGYSYRAIYLATGEILFHAAFATSILGPDSGFDLYLWPLAAWLAYHPEVKYRYAIVTGTACIAIWVAGRFYWTGTADIAVSVETLAAMLRVNATIAGLAFTFAIISARILVEQQNRLLTERAIRDELTGLYNRHYLTDFIHNIEQDGLFETQHYALIVTDIDHFKTINDRYGHETGDRVLKAFATCLLEQVRTDDLVCRWGGEEFIIILPNCRLDIAQRKAEAIRRTVADGIIEDERMGLISITASFGVTLSAAGERFDVLVSRADGLLYQAKESGRNRVVAQ